MLAQVAPSPYPANRAIFSHRNVRGGGGRGEVHRFGKEKGGTAGGGGFIRAVDGGGGGGLQHPEGAEQY